MRIAVIICNLLLLPVVAASVRTDLEPAQMHQDLEVLKRALEEAVRRAARLELRDEAVSLL